MFHNEDDPKHKPKLFVEHLGNNVYKISVTVGNDVRHPNEPGHSIEWVDIFFEPEDGEVITLARITLHSHGEVKSEPSVSIKAEIPKKGKIIAVSYCTKHGLWKTSVDLP